LALRLRRRLRDAHVVKVDPKDFTFITDFCNVVMMFRDDLPVQMVPAWQLSGLQNRPAKDALPYSRNEWKNMDKHPADYITTWTE
jgi:hypothetical protein